MLPTFRVCARGGLAGCLVEKERKEPSWVPALGQALLLLLIIVKRDLPGESHQAHLATEKSESRCQLSKLL